MLVQKTAQKVRAWCLGEDSPMERKLTRDGRLLREADGTYRVMSQENNTQGQIVPPGDYIKVDSTGAPYPNSREFFLQYLTHIEGDWYWQAAPLRKAWCREEEICPEVEYLMESGRLRIDESNPERYYNAFLWGAELHAAKDAVIIFDHRDTPEDLSSVGFRFITREEFCLTYRIVG